MTDPNETLPGRPAQPVMRRMTETFTATLTGRNHPLRALDEKRQTVLLAIGVVLVAFGLAVIGWEVFHGDDWHLWMGFLCVVTGLACVWPPIVDFLVKLFQGVAALMPGRRKDGDK